MNVGRVFRPRPSPAVDQAGFLLLMDGGCLLIGQLDTRQVGSGRSIRRSRKAQNGCDESIVETDRSAV